MTYVQNRSPFLPSGNGVYPINPFQGNPSPAPIGQTPYSNASQNQSKDYQSQIDKTSQPLNMQLMLSSLESRKKHNELQSQKKIQSELLNQILEKETIESTDREMLKNIYLSQSHFYQREINLLKEEFNLKRDGFRKIYEEMKQKNQKILDLLLQQNELQKSLCQVEFNKNQSKFQTNSNIPKQTAPNIEIDNSDPSKSLKRQAVQSPQNVKTKKAKVDSTVVTIDLETDSNSISPEEFRKNYSISLKELRSDFLNDDSKPCTYFDEDHTLFYFPNIVLYEENKSKRNEGLHFDKFNIRISNVKIVNPLPASITISLLEKNRIRIATLDNKFIYHKMVNNIMTLFILEHPTKNFISCKTTNPWNFGKDQFKTLSLITNRLGYLRVTIGDEIHDLPVVRLSAQTIRTGFGKKYTNDITEVKILYDILFKLGDVLPVQQQLYDRRLNSNDISSQHNLSFNNPLLPINQTYVDGTLRPPQKLNLNFNNPPALSNKMSVDETVLPPQNQAQLNFNNSSVPNNQIYVDETVPTLQNQALNLDIFSISSDPINADETNLFPEDMNPYEKLFHIHSEESYIYPEDNYVHSENTLFMDDI